MKAQKWMLRIASIIIFLHAAFHSIGALTWKQAPDAGVAKVVDGMLQQTFSFGGRTVSLGSFYEGYGISMIFMLLLISILLWLVSSAAAQVLVKRIVLVIAVSLLALSVTEWIYFFPAPAIFSFIAAMTSLFAAMRKNKNA
jgi:hypothetical protein